MRSFEKGLLMHFRQALYDRAFVMPKLFYKYAVQLGSHEPIVAVELVKCDICAQGTKL